MHNLSPLFNSAKITEIQKPYYLTDIQGPILFNNSVIEFPKLENMEILHLSTDAYYKNYIKCIVDNKLVYIYWHRIVHECIIRYKEQLGAKLNDFTEELGWSHGKDRLNLIAGKTFRITLHTCQIPTFDFNKHQLSFDILRETTYPEYTLIWDSNFEMPEYFE